MAEVIEINDPRDLEAHRATWEVLFARTRCATFFQTLDWLQVYWRHFGADQKLRVLIVQQRGEAIGIVPLCVRTERHRLGKVRTLGYPLDAWDHFYTPLGDLPQETLAAAIRHLHATPRDWDRLQLVGAADDSDSTRQGMTFGGMPPVATQTGAASMVDLTGGWEQYLATRSAKTRHMLRRNLREVEQSGAIEYVRHRPQGAGVGDADPRWDLYDACQQVAEQSWQSHSIEGNTLCHARYRDFYRETHATAARLGMVDLNLLYVGGRPLAFNYNYITHRRLTGLRMGYDPHASRLGAGMLLVASMLADSCERGDTLLDLGAGGQSFKRRLCTSELPSHELTYTPLTAIRCQALRLARWARGEAAAAGK